MSASHDVLLVGGGAAGLRAAIAVAEVDPGLRVAVVSKVYPMRSHTVSAEGGAAGVIADGDSLEEHAHDTVSGSDWLSDQDAVEAFVEEAPRELLRLEHWGCPWSREPDGHIAVRAFGGMKQMRTWFAADKTGFHMLHTLFQTSLKFDAVTRYDEWFVTRLLVDDGRVQGVVAIELASGRVEAITAKAVVLCNGGCGRVFPFTTNASINTGDGMALAWRAGVPLKDMELVQYHPTGLHRDPHHRSRPRRGRLAAEQGRLPLPAGLRPRQARPATRAAQHGARASGPALAGLRPRGREGPGHGHAIRPRRPPGPAAPRREAHRQQAPVRA
jgi:fumarate reductase flavoprotein subunit